MEERCGIPRCRVLVHRFEQGPVPWLIRASSRRTTRCIEWPFGRYPNGYGRVTWNGRRTYAHQVMCELVHGPRPDGLEVRHLCGHYPCVNPAHLVWDTHAENCLDRDRPERYLQGTR